MSVRRPAPEPAAAVLQARIDRAARALLHRQQPDGHWVFELEADATIPAEYILLRHYLGEPDDLELERKIAAYLRRIQAADHGGWPLFEGGAFDISASVKAYFALKMIGGPPNAPHMVRAREAIRAHGGAQASNVLTRFLLALYGETPWRDLPAMPVELMVAPRWFPIHLSKISYWARTTIVPMLVLQALKPRARNPRGVRIRELYEQVTPARRVSQAADTSLAWTAGFRLLDMVLKLIEPVWPKGLRARAQAKAIAFITERLNVDGLGAIYPPMANTVMMFDALGYPPEHPQRALARTAVERLLVIRAEEAYCQPCVSPIWDTALAAHALLECGGEVAETAAGRALDWLLPRQVLEVAGDWAEQRPNVRPGGWAFQYNNDHYPDLDDTAVVAMAMDRARRLDGSSKYDAAIARGAEWVEGLQSDGGGWAAFDADNTCHYLNNIPFADHGALLDPPTEDVTARCVSLLAQLSDGGAPTPQVVAAIRELERTQRPEGCWFGRWGVNYIYGTWSALCALNAAGLDNRCTMVRKATDWLKAVQNPDGGWGEDCDSYRLDYDGHRSFRSTASQTAWALLGLMAAGLVDDPAVRRGVDYLLRSEDAEGFWPETSYTGGGFPRVFYLRYHGYAKFFPLWALARYRNLVRTNSAQVRFGM